MKKKTNLLYPGKTGYRKVFRIMRISLFLILISTLQILAENGYSQSTPRLTLDMKNATIKDVLFQIENQSGFYFLYDNSLIDVHKKVDVIVQNEQIDVILNKIFGAGKVNANIKDRHIVLTPAGVPVTQQTHKVSGTVTDSGGSPLPGVTVVVKGTTNGTVTNADGEYSVSNFSENAKLVFSFVGMKTQEVIIGSQTSINVRMEEETIGIEEVVAVGYGTMKKSDLTGAITSVKGDEIGAFSTNNPIQALMGRAAGIQVQEKSGAPGGTMQVRIRGTNSIQGDNEPLYVIDGFPGDISILNNAVIESVEILKDASATAIYGSRGANGVILITTEQGKKGSKIEFESSYGIQKVNKQLELMNAKEYAELYNKLADYRGVDSYFSQNEIDNFGKGTDWQDIVFRTAAIQNHILTINGGTEKTKVMLSGSFFDQDGIIKGSDYQKYSLNMNVNHEVSKKLNVKIGTILSRVDRNIKDSEQGGYGSSLITAILFASPTFNPYNEDGTIRPIDTYGFVNSNVTNPLYFIKEINSKDKANNAQANVAFSYKLVPDLVVRLAGSFASKDFRKDKYITNEYVGNEPPGSASVSTTQYLHLLGENTITYTKIFDKRHKLNALAGFTCEDEKLTSLSASGSGIANDVLETYDLRAVGTVGSPSSSYVQSTLLSYLGRVNYSYRDRYLLTISMRADGSSKYSDGQKWGYFPSGALAWRISDENFMKEVDFISNLKMRIGWGRTGSQAINAYATQVTLRSGRTAFDDSGYTYFAPSTTFPGDLKWETTEQKDIGLDVGFLDNRMHLTVDYYYKKTRDLLNNVTLPSSQGWTRTIQNIGSIENKGVELAFDANVFNSNFQWNISGNIALNRSKVLKLNKGQDITGSKISLTYLNDYINILREGHPFAAFYGYIEDGYDDAGQINYKDIKNDGVINSLDKTFIGDPNPKFIYGFNSNMSFHRFELIMFFDGSYGNDIFNLSSLEPTVTFGNGPNLLKEVYYDHWTPDNVNAKYPAITEAIGTRASDRFVEDGSYLRLRNIQLGYLFNLNKYGVNKLQLYISGQNLITFTKYSWWNPQINSYAGGNSINQGIDHYTYPIAKSVNCGVKVSF